MLYRLRPHQQIQWIDMPREVRSAAAEHGIDLDGLDWLAADPATEDTSLLRLRLALRHGTASRTGIVVDAVDFAVVSHGERIRSAYKDMVAFRPTYRNTLAAMESFMPGTLAVEDKSNAEIDTEMIKTLAQSDADLAGALDVVAVADLVDHWSALGGFVPEPV